MLPQFPPPLTGEVPINVNVTNLSDLTKIGPTMRKSTSDAAADGLGVTAGNLLVANARRFFSVMMTNPSGTNYYLQVYDKTASPGNGSTPIVSVACPAGEVRYVDIPTGYPLINGLFVTNSTTNATLTAGGADCLFAAAFSV